MIHQLEDYGLDQLNEALQDPDTLNAVTMDPDALGGIPVGDLAGQV